MMKHNAILCNSGHFDCEVDAAALSRLAVEHFPSGRISKVSVSQMGVSSTCWPRGRLVNLAAGNGHPAEIMDMSFAVQALSLEWMAKHASSLEKRSTTSRQRSTTRSAVSSWPLWDWPLTPLPQSRRLTSPAGTELLFRERKPARRTLFETAFALKLRIYSFLWLTDRKNLI